ncbi:type II secretion system protein GspL [Hahella sp. SMD15-11]|uniref:Type II secretion system protein L n=1 Tax=Thermohahella caldifontis TaxID=3142973 RepID=A0AB39UXK3_9GAMM
MLLELVVRPGPEDTWQWLLASADLKDMETGEGSQEALEQALLHYADTRIRVHILLPAEQVVALLPVVPARQTRLYERIIPNLVEDDLGEEIERCHFAWGKRQEGNRVPVRVVSRSIMDAWTDWAGNNGLLLQGIWSEADILPTADNLVSLVSDGDRILFRHPRGLCGALPREGINLLDTLFSDPPGLTAQLYHPKDEDVGVTIAQLEQTGLQRVESQPYGSLFEWLGTRLLNGAEQSINLCTGPYQPRETDSQKHLKAWWPVAAVLLLGLTLGTGLNVAEGLYYQKQAEHYRSQQVALYRQWFPGARVLASPRKQLASKLQQLSGSGQEGVFLQALHDTAMRIRQNGQGKISVRSLQFTQEKGELAVEVRAPALADLESVREALSKAGYQVDIGSAVREADGVRSRLRIRRS